MSDTLATLNRLQRLEDQYADLAAEMASRFRDHSGMIVGVLEEVNRLRTRYEAHLLVHELDALESDAAPDDSAETPAQQRYREANERHYSNREVEMAAGAFDRAEEVAQELNDWTHLIHMRLNTMSIRLTALASPAPAPDPVCAICGGAGKRYTNGYCESCNGSGLITERVACANSDCGHTEDLHTHPAFGLGFCLRCPCPDYVPAPDPVCKCGHGQGHHMGKTEFCGKITRTYHDERSDETCQCKKFVPPAEPEPAPLDPALLDQSELSLLQALIRKALMGQRNDSTRFRLNAINAKLIAYGRDGAR